MIKTIKMHKMAEYSYYGVTEAVYRTGTRYYMSIIDHRSCDTKLDGIYDQLGVYRVDREYIDKWASTRGLTI